MSSAGEQGAQYPAAPGRPQQHELFPIPRLAALPPPRPAARDVLLVVLLMGVCLAGGYGLSEYGHWQKQVQLQENGVPVGEGTLSLPPDVRVTVGEPAELLATTRGRRVVWMSLDRELVLKPASTKSVWVWGSKPGVYRLIAWTAVDDLPTLNATATVTVEEAKGGQAAGSGRGTSK